MQSHILIPRNDCNLRLSSQKLPRLSTIDDRGCPHRVWWTAWIYLFLLLGDSHHTKLILTSLDSVNVCLSSINSVWGTGEIQVGLLRAVPRGIGNQEAFLSSPWDDRLQLSCF
ncbi:hypothetical protein BgiMline_003408 [Biomphalaria glabrata]